MERADLFVKYDGNVLKPASRFDAAQLSRFRRDVALQADIRERRRLPRQRLYWAVLQAVCDAKGLWPNVEALHHAIKLHTGFIEEITSLNGEILIRPRSTSFARMDESEFRQFMDAAMLAITTEVVPGLSVEDLLALGRARLGPGECAA